jgi:hypothetical protein
MRLNLHIIKDLFQNLFQNVADACKSKDQVGPQRRSDADCGAMDPETMQELSLFILGS